MKENAAVSSPIAIDGIAPRWHTLAQLVEATAAQAPAGTGIEIDGRFRTYVEIAERARRVAGNLQRLGVGPGDRVCSLLSNCPEVLDVWFGTVLAGAIWVPINAGLAGEDLAYTLGDAAPAVLVVDREGVARVAEAASVARIDLPPERFAIDAPAPAGYRDFGALLDPAAPFTAPAIEPSDPAAIVYTGGTTGLPKGVVLPHFAMLCGGLRYREAFDAQPGDRHFSVSPLFHAGGMTLAVLGPMVARMNSVIDRNFSVSRYWERVRATRATIINPIGVILTLLCRQDPSDADRDHHVRLAAGITGQLPDDIPREFTRRFGVELVNVYALTEASGAMIVYNSPGSVRPAANGRASKWVDIAIVDPFDAPLPAGQVGHIVLRPKVPYTFMLGYHNNDRATVEAWRNLWLHTGDLGRLDEAGYLYFLGREAHWIRRRGENISAYELERIIGGYPGITELAAVGVPAAIGEEEVKVFVVMAARARFDPADLVQWCAERMAAFKVPRFVEVLDALPRTAAKREIERHTLRAMPNDRAWDREAVFGRRMPPRR